MCESVKASKRKQNGTKSKKGCRDRRVRLSRRLAHNIRIKLESNFSSRSVDDFMITSVKSALRQTLYALLEKEEKRNGDQTEDGADGQWFLLVPKVYRDRGLF